MEEKSIASLYASPAKTGAYRARGMSPSPLTRHCDCFKKFRVMGGMGPGFRRESKGRFADCELGGGLLDRRGELVEAASRICYHRLAHGERAPARLNAANHRYQSRRNLYSFFITQNVNASRILIVETAFDPCNRVRTHASQRQRAGIHYPGLSERASI
jgi:hypothetical protein